MGIKRRKMDKKRELGILDGRHEMAMQIKTLIKEWEKKYYG